jgi:hypothetical protein
MPDEDDDDINIPFATSLIADEIDHLRELGAPVSAENISYLLDLRGLRDFVRYTFIESELEKRRVHAER